MKQLSTILLFLLTVSTWSQDTYIIDQAYPVHDLMPHLKILEDEKGTLDYQTILEDSTLTYKARSDFGKYLKIGSTYWGKLKLAAKDSLIDWTINFQDKMIGPPAWTKSNGKVDVYGFIDNELVYHEKTGVEYSKSERSTSSHWVLNQTSLEDFPVNKPVTLLIRAQGNSIGYPAYFNLSIRHNDQAYYHQIYQFNNSFNIFMFGVTFIIFLYHLLQFVYLRDKVMLWFSVWMFFIMLTQSMTVGFITGSTINLRYSVQALITNGVFYTFWFFGRAFINSKEKYPKLDKLILGLAIFVLIESIILSIYVPIYKPQTYHTGVGIHYHLILVYILLSMALSFVLMFKKDRFAKYFGFGSIIATFFLLSGTLWSLGVISYLSFFKIDPYATGMFLQIIIYSFGIAYRRQVIQKRMIDEQIQAQKSLHEIKRIKDLDNIKTRFFANISHEFRTPLTLISGPIKKAMASSESEKPTISIRKKDFDIINKNTSRLQHLVDQLLDLSKLESGKVHLSLRQGGIIQFLRSLVFSFESMAERNNISLNTSFPDEIDHAFYDKDKLEKILTNVLSNAFKYTPNNGTITFSVNHNDDFINLEITDTGKGINQEDVKRIFERFYRVEGTEEKGSGIGLALTKELIDLHNGKISVDSTQRKGTTFKIKLPISLKYLPQNISVVSSNQNSIKTLSANHAVETNEPISIEEYEITSTLPVALVVEDNPDLQYFITEVIKNYYSVLNAEDGAQGERMAFEHTPDIIITDIMMPKKDGYQLCHSLKNNPKTSHIPIIMLTAKAGEINKMEGLTQGADVYLTKPFNENELLIRMKNLIDSRKKLWHHFKALDMFLVDDIKLSSIDDKFLQDVFQTIKHNIDNEQFGVEDIAKNVGFSRSQLHRKLKALSNKSANQLISEIRLNEAHRMLKSKVGSVSEVAYSVGYSNLSYFAKSFKDKFGVLPSKV